MSYKKLKSGTDVRGIASSLGGNTVDLTQEAISEISYAFVVWFVNKFAKASNDLKISVGHDSRITADSISSSVINASASSGLER